MMYKINFIFRVSSLAYPNLLGKKGYVVVVVVVVVVFIVKFAAGDLELEGMALWGLAP